MLYRVVRENLSNNLAFDLELKEVEERSMPLLEKGHSKHQIDKCEGLRQKLAQQA